MSNETIGNELTDKEVVEFLELTNKLSTVEFIRYVWKCGYEWGKNE